MRLKSIFFVGTLLMSLVGMNFHVSAETAVSKKTINKSASTTVQVAGSDKGNVDLQLTGSAVRTKFFVKVYEISHYMQNPPSVKGEAAIQQILADGSNIKFFSIKWLRKASGSQVQSAFRETLEKTLGSQYASLKGPIEQFLGFFKEGGNINSVSTITWRPDGSVVVEFNNKKIGEIKNPKLAHAIWEIWFGPHSVVNKSELVSNL